MGGGEERTNENEGVYVQKRIERQRASKCARESKCQRARVGGEASRTGSACAYTPVHLDMRFLGCV